jgi:hypothetical protein
MRNATIATEADDASRGGRSRLRRRDSWSLVLSRWSGR